MAGKAKYVIKRAKNGQYYFVLQAANGEIIATGETYVSKQGAIRGIDSVKTNAFANISDESNDVETVRCFTCNSTGQISTVQREGGWIKEPCPSCGGTGIDKEATELLHKDYGIKPWKDK